MLVENDTIENMKSVAIACLIASAISKSQYAILSRIPAQDMYSNNPLVCRIQTLLIRLPERAKSVTLCWVPSHIGVPGNENADKLAKDATTNPQPPRLYKNFYRDLYPAIKRIFFKQWEEEWVNAGALRPNKLLNIKRNVSPWPSSSIPRMRL